MSYTLAYLKYSAANLDMPLRSDKNLYPGVNAHLNSFLQSKGGGWESFHARHIADIATLLDQQLPQQYYAALEKSLQVTEIGFVVEQSSQRRPDVGIYHDVIDASERVSSAGMTAPTAVFPLAEVLVDPEDHMMSVGIYRIDSGEIPGRLVTRIELLSPSNKPGDKSYQTYLVKRFDTLSSGISLIEIDYLHETRPIIPHLAVYNRDQPNAHPYYAIVSDTHPEPENGRFEIYGFEVDGEMPTIRVPLADSDDTSFNLGAVYNFSFEATRLLNRVVNYAVEPERMSSYTPADQERIRQRMKTIAQQLGSS